MIGQRGKNGGIEEEKEKKVVPRAIATYGWELKIGRLGSKDSKKSLHNASRALEIKDQRKYRKFD